MLLRSVNSDAKEISEADMLEALLFAHEEIKRICEFQEEIVNELKPKKLEILPLVKDEKLILEIRKLAYDKISQALVVFEKQARDQALKDVKEEIFLIYENKETFLNLKEADQLIYHNKLDAILEDLIKEEFRSLITKDKIRPDGRKTDEIRPLSSRIDLLPRAHGSALFTRGQTQSLEIGRASCRERV